MPPSRSGIADYSHALLPFLAEKASLTLFVDDPLAVDEGVRQKFPVLNIASYPERRWSFDVALYQMGNSDHHENMYQMMNRFPGITVLHDYFLHTFIAHRTVGRNNFPAYARDLAYALGSRGFELARRIKRREAVMPLDQLPLNDRVLDLSLSVMVHSDYARSMIQARAAGSRVSQLPPMIETRTGTDRRSETPWDKDTIIFASVGQVTINKRLDLALRAFGRLRRETHNVGYLIVGEQLPEVDLPSLLSSLNLEDSVYWTGHVDSVQSFVDWICTANIVVNLRHPTIGETSASALRAMASARPLIVFDQGWYHEIPGDACVKIPPMDEDGLLAEMRALASEPERRLSMGQAGSAFVQAECQPAFVADAYINHIENLIAELKIRYV